MSEPFLSEAERQRLLTLAKQTAERAVRQRALLLLFYDEGQTTRQIAEQIDLSVGRVRHWRRAYLQRGWGIFPAEIPLAERKVETSMPASHKHSPVSQVAAENEQPAPGAPAKAKPDFAALRARAETLKKPGVLPSDSLAEAGRKVLHYHFAQMLLHEPGTRLGEDIEALHDMRVATRRMRVAMEIFAPAFQEKAVKKLSKGLRLTGRTLGKVRDLDVLLEKFAQDQQVLPEDDLPGLQPLADHWQAQRSQARQELLAYLDSKAYAGFVERFAEFVETPGAGSRKAAPFTPQRADHLVPGLVYTRLAAVRAYDGQLDSAPLERFHALRIEFKYLRYTLEYFREILALETKPVIAAIKAMQDHLGNLNDADVACRLLDEFLTGWQAGQEVLPLAERGNPEALIHYLAYKHAERHHLQQGFPAAWVQFNRPEVRQWLAQAVAQL